MGNKRARWTSEAIGDRSGQLAIVTGANSGIGYETARALAAKGAAVILACRSEERGQKALGELQREMPEAELELGSADRTR